MSSPTPHRWLYIGLPVAIVMASAMLAHAFDTTWIAPGNTLSAAQLKADLDEAQTRLAALEASSPIVTSWAAYSPTLVSASNGASVGNSTTVGKYRRVGDSVELQILTSLSGTPTGTGCNDFWEWGLPPGLTADSTKLLTNGVTGFGNAYQGGSGNAKLIAFLRSGKIVAVGDQDCFLSATAPFTFGTSGAVELFITLPITGWTASQ